MTVAPPTPVYLGPAKFHGGAQPVIRRITIHATVSPCAEGGARAIARYFRETVTRPSSAHYVVDPGETVQVVMDHTVAYHAPPNTGAIGVELCDPQAGLPTRWFDEPHRRMLDRAARLVARLCLAYNVPIRKLSPAELFSGEAGISGHSDVSAAWHQTTHTDPGLGFPWARFMRLVHRAAVRLLAAPKPTTDTGKVEAPPTKPTASLTVASANMHHGQDLQRAVDLTRADLIGFQEGDKLTRRSRLMGTDLGTLGAREVPVFLGSGLAYRGEGLERASRDTGVPVAHDRWVRWVRCIALGQQVALLNTHTNAAVQRRGSGLLRRKSLNAREYRRHMRHLAELVQEQQDDGQAVIVTGDFNYRLTSRLTLALAWRWAPHRLFPRLGLVYVAEGLDGIAYDPRRFTATAHRAVPTSANGSDHPWPVLTLTAPEEH